MLLSTYPSTYTATATTTYLHAVALHLREGREAHAVEPAVVDVVDEQLRRATVGRARLGEGHLSTVRLKRVSSRIAWSAVARGLWSRAKPASPGFGPCVAYVAWLVGDLDRLVGDGLGAPAGGDVGVAVEAELHHEARQHTEEPAGRAPTAVSQR